MEFDVSWESEGFRTIFGGVSGIFQAYCKHIASTFMESKAKDASLKGIPIALMIVRGRHHPGLSGRRTPNQDDTMLICTIIGQKSWNDSGVGSKGVRGSMFNDIKKRQVA